MLQKLLPAIAAVAIAGCAQGSPTAPGANVEILGIRFTLACGFWNPSEPPVKRTVVDLEFIGPERVSDFVLEVLRLNGAVVTYSFQAGRMVRAEIDVDRLRPLMQPPVSLWTAVTVPNPDAFPLNFFVSLDHPTTDQDLMAAQDLGGQVLSRSKDWYTVFIDDRRRPQLRALPGVRSVSVNGLACLS